MNNSLFHVSKGGYAVKILSSINESKDIVTKQYVDALTDTFVKTFTETFDTSDYIASSTNIERESGYIRANRQIQVDQNSFSSATASSTNNIAYDAGRIKLASSTNNASGEYISNFHTGLTNSDTFILNANFDHITAPTWGSESAITPASGTLQSDMVHYKQVIDVVGNVWHFYQVRSTGSLYGWVTDSNGNNIVPHTLLSTGVAAIAVSPAVQAYRTLQAQVSSAGNVYVTFWTGGSSTLGRIRTLKLRINVGSLQYGTTTNTWQSGAVVFDDFNPQHATIHCVDTFYDNTLNRLHIVYQTGTSTFGAAHRVINATSFSQFSQTVLWADSGAKQISIAYNDTPGAREIGIFFFDAGTSNAVRAFRYILDTFSYPNGAGGTATGVTFARSCFGMGGASYDSANNRYLLFYVQQPSSGVSNQFETSHVTKDFTTNANLTALTTMSGSTYGTTTYKDTAVYLDGNVLYVLVPNNDTVNRNYLIHTFNAITGASIIINTLISGATSDLYPAFVKQGSTLRVVWSRLDSAGTSASPFSITFGTNSSKIIIQVKNSTSNWVLVYQDIGAVNDVNYLNIPITLPTSDTQLQVSIALYTPNGSSETPFFNSYQITVTNSGTGATTGVFESTSLINDRLVSKATLSADVTTAGLSGTITWRMSNNGGTNWVSVTPGVETVFDNVGNNLKVEGSIAIGSGIANANSVQINSYTVTTTNVVLQSELNALQVNMLKLGLQINTLTTMNRFSYKNMMIDLFETGAGVTGMSVTGGLITGTGTVTSTIEPADILEVNSIIVCAEGIGTITYDVSRDGGISWHQNVALDTVIPLTLGSTKNQIRIRANLTSATLYGWAYLYA